MARSTDRLVLNAAGAVAALLTWEGFATYLAATHPMGASILPSFEVVFRQSLPSFGLMWQGEGGSGVGYDRAAQVLLQHSMATLFRVIAGFVAGSVAGIGLAILISSSRLARNMIWPTIQALRQVPSLALVPLFLLWFGGSELGVFIYISWAIMVVVLVYAIEAIGLVDPYLRDYGRTLGATRLQGIRTILLPALMPLLIGPLRVALGLSWAVAIAAEFLGAQVGLGKLLLLSQMYFDTGRMLVIVALLILYGVILNAMLVRVSYRLTKWIPQ